VSLALRDIGPVMLIGAGKMGLSLARGWLEAGMPPENLVLVDPHPSPDAKDLANDYGLMFNENAVGLQPNVLVLAVKPQIIDPVLDGLGAVMGPHTLVISIVAGIDIARLSEGLATGRVVRTMPNTPAQLGKGITGAFAGPDVDARGREVTSALLEAVGGVVWLDREADIDAVTAVSGSGPAYVFHLVEALAAAAEAEGLKPDIAMRLARATVVGAAALLDADPAPAETLRKNVTSPNGTTAAGLNVLMPELPKLITRTVSAARKRSEELGRK
jgi:pyrroline-5-carboxylate reductase